MTFITLMICFYILFIMILRFLTRLGSVLGLCNGLFHDKSWICWRIGIYANITIYSRDDGVLGLTSAAGCFMCLCPGYAVL
jgi:hypothetical protein